MTTETEKKILDMLRGIGEMLNEMDERLRRIEDNTSDTELVPVDEIQ